MRDYAELIARLKQSDENCNAECCECSGECLSSGCNIFSEAADAIEELLAKVPKWISVEERLPEFHTNDSGCVCTRNIVFRTEYKTVNLGYVIRTAHNIETVDGFEQIVVDRWYDQSGDMIEDVTHWMPLPEPPEEDSYD